MNKYNKYIILFLSILIAIAITLCFIPISVSKLIPTIEQQVEKELGVNVKIEKLILRVGPFIKLKSPVVHLLYCDNNKFAQIDNVKFKISLFSIITKKPRIKSLRASNFSLRLTSEDENFVKIINNLKKKNVGDSPNLNIKKYNITYRNLDTKDVYSIQGHDLQLNKIKGVENWRIITNGNLVINNKKYINYDIDIIPKFDLPKESFDINLVPVIEQIKDLDFHADIISNLKLYKVSSDIIQASGYTNIDNISVLDIEKKNPKSFIYLTLWGDKASLVSNIFTSTNKKVSVEGMINGTKKPIIDLKIKAEDVKLEDIYQNLKIFLRNTPLASISNITGIVNANFNLKGDVNKIKSNGYLKINNASVIADGVQVSKITSNIDFSNNVINIIDAVGFVNDAPIIAKGKIDKEVDVELLMNKVELKHLLPQDMGVEKGRISLVADLKGPFNNIIHKEKLQIEDFVIKKNNLGVSFDSFNYDTNKSNTATISALAINTTETEVIKIPTAKIQIDDESIKVPSMNIFMPNSKLVGNCSITNFNTKEIGFNTSLNGFINSRDLKRFKDSSIRYPIKLIYNGNKNAQNLNAQVLVESAAIFDEPVIVNLASKIEKNLFKIDDFSILSAEKNFSDDFKVNLKNNKKLSITGCVENFKAPVFKNLRLFIPQQLNIKIQDTLAQLKGDLFINGDIASPEIIGQVLLQNLFNQSLQLSVNNASLDFNKNVVMINAPLVKIADTSMGINSNILTDLTKALVIKNINIKSKFLNTDTILMYKDSPILNSFPIIIENGKFYSEKILANIYGSTLYLSAFNSDISLNNDLLNLKNLTAELFNGKLMGTLDYNLKDEHYNAKIMARSVSASPIFDIVSTRKDSISGTMDFDTDLKGELTSKQSLNGDIKFLVQNGRMSSLGKLEHLLYAQNVIADNMLRTSLSVVTKAITLKDTGLFKYLRGDIYLENGIANIKLLQSQGPLMTLFIKGIYNTVNDNAQLVVLGRLSDEIISGLGAFGDFSINKLMIMLTGEDTKYNVLPQDFEKIPPLPMKNTKEFRSIINGNIDKSNSVLLFNWISYSQKSLKQKEVPMTNIKVPTFVDNLPY